MFQPFENYPRASHLCGESSESSGEQARATLATPHLPLGRLTMQGANARNGYDLGARHCGTARSFRRHSQRKPEGAQHMDVVQ